MAWRVVEKNQFLGNPLGSWLKGKSFGRLVAHDFQRERVLVELFGEPSVMSTRRGAHQSTPKSFPLSVTFAAFGSSSVFSKPGMTFPSASFGASAAEALRAHPPMPIMAPSPPTRCRNPRRDRSACSRPSISLRLMVLCSSWFTRVEK